MPSGVYKRKPRTPEHCAALSKAHMGVLLSPEHCDAISRSHKGVSKPPRTSEHCAALSKSHTGVPLSSEHITAISKALTGRSLTLEHCVAIAKGITGVPKSPKHNAAVSKSHISVQLSPEHCAAMSKGREESGVNEIMCGGLDLVWHHTLYDHADLSKNRVAMTRRNHTMGHRLLQVLGIKILHINGIEDAE